MATRKKKTVIQGVTREDAEVAFAAFAKADASINKIQSEVELQCAKIREKHQADLTRLTAERDAAFETLQSFAIENKAELFSKKKSLDMTHGTIGFRTGTPKLKTLKGFTWEAAKNLVKTFLPSYIRQTEEIAKDKMLADRDVELMAAGGDPNNWGYQPLRDLLSNVGIQVVQDEAFYVEPKKEDSV